MPKIKIAGRVVMHLLVLGVIAAWFNGCSFPKGQIVDTNPGQQQKQTVKESPDDKQKKDFGGLKKKLDEIFGFGESNF